MTRIQEGRLTSTYGSSFPFGSLRTISIEAGSPQHAEEIYQYIVEECRKAVPLVQTGIFGADMKVSLLNDGPFTILLDEHAFAAQN